VLTAVLHGWAQVAPCGLAECWALRAGCRRSSLSVCAISCLLAPQPPALVSLHPSPPFRVPSMPFGASRGRRASAASTREWAPPCSGQPSSTAAALPAMTTRSRCGARLLLTAPCGCCCCSSCINACCASAVPRSVVCRSAALTALRGFPSSRPTVAGANTAAWDGRGRLRQGAWVPGLRPRVSPRQHALRRGQDTHHEPAARSGAAVHG